MFDKNIYSYWYVGKKLNYYNDEKDATVTNPSLKVRYPCTPCPKICCDNPVYAAQLYHKFGICILVKKLITSSKKPQKTPRFCECST
jgi:hypothetical protein